MEKIKYFKVKETANNSKINFKQILKGAILATALAILFLIIGAMVFTYTDISMTFVNAVSNVVFYVCAFISGMIGSMKLKVYGWIHGILSGVIYAIIIFVINVLSGGAEQIWYLSLLKILFSVIIGSVGGIVGVNFQFSKKRH